MTRTQSIQGSSGIIIPSAITGGCPGGVLYEDGANNLAQDCANFLYNGTNLYLGNHLLLDNFIAGDIFVQFENGGSPVGYVGYASSLFGLFNGAGVNIATFDGTTYNFGNGSVTYDNNTFQLFLPGIQIDSSGNMYFLGNGSAQFAVNGAIYNSLGDNTLDWDLSRLIAGGNVVLGWGTLQMFDSGGSESLDWSNRTFTDSNTIISGSWENRALYDNTGSAGINWDARHLLSTASAVAIGWASGKIETYNAINTVANGVPAEYAASNLTTQGAAIGTTTLYAVPASGAGLYRISFVASITRAATTSSVLGGANGFRIGYTDADDSVAKASVAGNTATSAANTTATSISGVLIANCKASTNLTFQFDYTSVGVTSMQYNLHVIAEKL